MKLENHFFSLYFRHLTFTWICFYIVHALDLILHSADTTAISNSCNNKVQESYCFVSISSESVKWPNISPSCISKYIFFFVFPFGFNIEVRTVLCSFVIPKQVLVYEKISCSFTSTKLPNNTQQKWVRRERVYLLHTILHVRFKTSKPF